MISAVFLQIISVGEIRRWAKIKLTLRSVNIYATIIGIQRLVQHYQTKPGPKDITLRAARRVLSIILDFYADINLNAKFKSITNQSVAIVSSMYRSFC